MIDITRYSKKIGGDKGNYNWSATFDLSGSGYLGISQPKDTGGLDRILLSPKQVKVLAAFIQSRRNQSNAT